MKKVIVLLCLGISVFILVAAIKPEDSKQSNFTKATVLKTGLTNQVGKYDLMNNLTSSQNVKYLPDKIIVRLKSTTPTALSKRSEQIFSDISSLKANMEKYGIYQVDKVFPMQRPPAETRLTDLSRIYELSFAPSLDPWQVAKVFAADENVEYAEPHFVYELAFTPDDSLYKEQGHLSIINAAKAWDITKGSKDVKIAIVDAGVNWSHPDLVNNIWQNLGEDADGDGHTIEFKGSQWVLDPGDLNGIDDDDFDHDRNTFIDDLIGWDVANGDNDPVNSDTHGTHVAGLASATTNNAIGVAGVGFNCRIMPVNAASDGQDFIDFGFAGIKYAVDAGANIINMSWGGAGASSFGLDIINYAHEHNVVLVASAGNLNEDEPFYPAAYPHVLSVAATTSSDSKASFSNFGLWVDLSAPGVSLLSTNRDGKYSTWSGTSFASPVVAGVAALVKSYHLNWSADQVAEQVRVSSDNIESQNSSYRRKLGFGRVNAYQSLTKTSPAIRITQVSVPDKSGDGDNKIDRGEFIELTVSVANYLETANNVTLTLEEDDVNITPVNYTANIGAIGSGKTVTNADKPFQFRVAKAAPRGRLIEFVLNIEANNGAYRDWEPFYLTIAPRHGDHDAGNVILTVTDFGAMGFYEYVDNEISIGNGFQFPKGSTSALFHGSFMVGTDKEHVSDVAYGNETHTAFDWVTENDGDLIIQKGTVANQEGFARYNDSGAAKPIGVMVTQHSYAYADSPNDDFVIMEYLVENKSGNPLVGLYTAVYMDWDILEPADDEAGYDNSLALGYMYDATSKYYGIALLSPRTPAAYRAINNSAEVFSRDRFQDSKKFQFMTEGLQVTKSDIPRDWSHLLSSGPFNLQPNESVKVAYAVLGGENLDDLKNNAEAARKIYFSSNTTTRNSVSGMVKYFSGNRPVANAEITLNGINKQITDALGAYSFSNITASTNQLAIKKEGDHRNAITGADALLCLQYLAFKKSLDDHQKKAADVGLNGQIEGSDVLAVQKYLAFVPTNVAQTAQWAFSPAEKSFDLASETNINFTAYLLGDCTGDWGQASNSLLSANDESSSALAHGQNKLDHPGKSAVTPAQIKATLILPQYASGNPGAMIPIPVKVSTDSAIGLTQFVVEYDSTVIQFDKAQIGADAHNFVVAVVNTNLPFLPSNTGVNKNVLVSVSGGGTSAIRGSGQEVVVLNFKAINGPGKRSPLIFDRGTNRTFLTTINLNDLKGNDIEFIDGKLLPTSVKLEAFAGTVDENQVRLVWETVSEFNNLGFEVERSLGQSQFEKLAFMQGAGTTSSAHQYRYLDKGLAPGTYYYRLKQINTNGDFEYIGTLQLQVKIPQLFVLHQNYPNPFLSGAKSPARSGGNPETNIAYELPEAAHVVIDIYDMHGQKIRTLVNDLQEPGRFSTIWDGTNNQGNSVASGIYIYRILAKSRFGADHFEQSRKIMVMR